MEKTPDQCFGFSREHGGGLFPADPYDGGSGAPVRELSEILSAEMASF